MSVPKWRNFIMRNGKKSSANSIQSPIGGGNNNNLQPRESGSTQYPPAKDHAAQDSIYCDR